MKKINSSGKNFPNNDNYNRLSNHKRGANEENSVEEEEEVEEDEAVKEKEESRKQYLKIAIDIIFADDSTLKNFPENYSSARFLQVQCVSNLFSSKDIDDLKKRMIPLFVNGIFDEDIRVRLLVAR